MAVYIVRRLLLSIPLLLGITIVIFFLAHHLPGGPLAMYLNTASVTPEQLQHLTVQLGLDKPVPVQYVEWLEKAVRGDFGHSFGDGRPVVAVIGDRIPATLELMGAAFTLSVVLAFTIGILSALRRDSFFDYLVTVVSYAGMSMPIFWLGILVIMLFGAQLHWLPTAGMQTPGAPFSLADNLRHLILPTCVLAAFTLAQESRYVRASVLDVIGQDYIRTARAKGLPENVVILKHALRNALIPVVTVLTLDAAYLLSGALVTETVFAWPGMGRLFYDSLREGNYPVVVGIAVLVSVLVVLLNILADVLYAVLDPRIKYG
ncbi:MAG TPA: ABC transporter permease [Candidatus Dormibacteraeota bacterium]|nr:ABC transporter permease [Candidatus Dormibacteraeota bacterium]